MQQARVMGNYAEQKAIHAGLHIQDICEALHCSDQKVKSFLKGRAFLSFDQLSTLASILHVSVGELMQGDPELYESTAVHCMNEFDDGKNREFVLDLIDDYMDVFDSLNI